VSVLVSIVVPVFDVEDYLEECLQSLAEQTHAALDVILVDDGSADHSLEICKRWCDTDPRFRLFQQNNQGSSVARNRGIDEARGDYLTFVDSDDVIAPDQVARLVELAAVHDADITASDVVMFDRDPPRFTRTDRARAGTAEEILHQLVCVKPRWGTTAKLYRRSLFDDGLRFVVGLRHQDLHLFPQIFARAERAVVTDDRLYGYRQRSGSIMHSARSVALSTDLLTVHAEVIEFARDHYSAAPPFADYLTAYLLQLSKYVERIPLGATWRRNRAFLAGYRSLGRRYWPELRAARTLSPGYATLWWLSTRSPLAFRLAFGVGSALKRTLLPPLRRSADALVSDS